MPPKGRSTSKSPNKLDYDVSRKPAKDMSPSHSKPPSLSKVFASAVATAGTKQPLQTHTRQYSGIDMSTEKKRDYNQELQAKIPKNTLPRPTLSKEEEFLIKSIKAGNTLAVSELISLRKSQNEQLDKVHSSSSIPEGYNEQDFDDVSFHVSSSDYAPSISATRSSVESLAYNGERLQFSSSSNSSSSKPIPQLPENYTDRNPKRASEDFLFRSADSTRKKAKRASVEQDTDEDNSSDSSSHSREKKRRQSPSKQLRRRLELLRELLQGDESNLDDVLDELLKHKTKSANGSLKQGAQDYLDKLRKAIKARAMSEWRVKDKNKKLSDSYLYAFAEAIDGDIKRLFAANSALRKMFYSAIKEAFWRLNDVNKRKFLREFDREFTDQILLDPMSSLSFFSRKDENVGKIAARVHGEEPTASDLAFYSGKPWDEAVCIAKGMKKSNIDSDVSSDASSSAETPRGGPIGPSPLGRNM